MLLSSSGEPSYPRVSCIHLALRGPWGTHITASRHMEELIPLGIPTTIRKEAGLVGLLWAGKKGIYTAYCRCFLLLAATQQEWRGEIEDGRDDGWQWGRKRQWCPSLSHGQLCDFLWRGFLLTQHFPSRQLGWHDVAAPRRRFKSLARNLRIFGNFLFFLVTSLKGHCLRNSWNC